MKATIGGSPKKEIDWSKANILKVNNGDWYLVINEPQRPGELYNKHFTGTIVHEGDSDIATLGKVYEGNLIKDQFDLFDLQITLSNE